MTIRPRAKAAAATAALIDLYRGYGIPLDRIRLDPLPGTATVADVEVNKSCELINGTLVQKAMGYPESILGGALIDALRAFVRPRKLGVVSGADGTLGILPGLVRIPGVAYVSRQRLPGGRIPKESVPAIAPDLAIEVLSKKNTLREMRRKRMHYFEAGVRLVWVVDRFKRTVSVYTGVDHPKVLKQTDTLDGGDVLPGFSLSLRNLFGELD